MKPIDSLVALIFSFSEIYEMEQGNAERFGQELVECSGFQASGEAIDGE
jgi:hypothetical protein